MLVASSIDASKKDWNSPSLPVLQAVSYARPHFPRISRSCQLSAAVSEFACERRIAGPAPASTCASTVTRPDEWQSVMSVDQNLKKRTCVSVVFHVEF
jgi:hypothetical protein